MDCSLPGPSTHGILQVRILEWLPFPFPGDLPNPGIEPGSPALQADSLLTEPPGRLLDLRGVESKEERTVAEDLLHLSNKNF